MNLLYFTIQRFARTFVLKSRNGKIHRYPLRVCKLLCFTKDVYERIRVVVKGLKKNRRVKPSLKKRVYYKQTKKVHKHSLWEANNVAYEPTNIWSTRNSQRWQWRRVIAWYREFPEEYDNVY